jgi:ProP effector
VPELVEKTAEATNVPRPPNPAALEPGEAIEATAQATPVGKRKQRQQQIGATIAQLAERYPQAFFVLGRQRKPLKIGIDGDIAAGGAIRPADLRWALCAYCASPGYLRSFQVGAARLDLVGNEADRVTAADVEHARQKLNEVLARRKPKPKPVASDEGGHSAASIGPEADSQRCKTTPLARPGGSAAGHRETGASEARPSDPALIQRSLAELRAAAARRRGAAGGA